MHLEHVKWKYKLFRGKINFPLKSAAGQALLYGGLTWSHSFDSQYIFSLGLFTKENGLGGRVEGLKPNVPNQEDELHNSRETRPMLCAKIKDCKYVYFGPISYSSVMLHAGTFYHSFLLFKSLYGCHRCCYYTGLLLFFMCC